MAVNTGRAAVRRSLVDLLGRHMDGITSGYHRAASSAAGRVQLEVSGSSLLMDERLRVAAGGLRPAQPVTVAAVLAEAGKVYAAFGHFTADAGGRLDLTEASSQGGTYTGVSGMGLFWSMMPTPDMRKGVRLLKDDVTTPLVTHLELHDGHVMLPDPRLAPSRPLASAVVQRWYKSPDVERIVVREEELVGTLFVPKGEGCYPGIVDVFGSVGGVVEHRAALLASRGFITFALGYISYTDIPPFKTDIEYFEKAVHLLTSHPRVRGRGIGMIGTSKGSDVCLLTSIFNPNVTAVVSIGGSPWVAGCKHVYKGWTIHPAGLDLRIKDGKYAFTHVDEIYEEVNTDEGMFYKLHPEKAPPESFIPVERTHAALLVVAGEDDPYVSEDTMLLLANRLRNAGRGDAITTLRYPGAGHLLEPPYAPHCRISYYSIIGGHFVWGGNTQQHAHAQTDLWARTLDFFRQHLETQAPSSKL